MPLLILVLQRQPLDVLKIVFKIPVNVFDYKRIVELKIPYYVGMKNICAVKRVKVNGRLRDLDEALPRGTLSKKRGKCH